MKHLIDTLTVERDHRERRVERLRILAGRPNGLSDSQQEEIEYNDGVRFGLDIALREANGLRAGDQRCACGKVLDANGEHDGGYGAWCGEMSAAMQEP